MGDFAGRLVGGVCAMLAVALLGVIVAANTGVVEVTVKDEDRLERVERQLGQVLELVKRIDERLGPTPAPPEPKGTGRENIDVGPVYEYKPPAAPERKPAKREANPFLPFRRTSVEKAPPTEDELKKALEAGLDATDAILRWTELASRVHTDQFYKDREADRQRLSDMFKQALNEAKLPNEADMDGRDKIPNLYRWPDGIYRETNPGQQKVLDSIPKGDPLYNFTSLQWEALNMSDAEWFNKYGLGTTELPGCCDER